MIDVTLRNGKGLITGHERTFASVFNSPAGTWRFMFDEALMQGSFEAYSMRRDPMIVSLIHKRTYPVLAADFRIECVGLPEGTEKEGIERKYKSAVEATTDYVQKRMALQEAVFYGRMATQSSCGRSDMLFEYPKAQTITRWLPILGDKITTTWDGIPAIRTSLWNLGQLFRRGYQVYDAGKLQDPEYRRSALVSRDDIDRIESDKSDDVFVASPADYHMTEAGPAILVERPELRQRLILHKHHVEDAPYDMPELAGMIGGVGLRNWAYWGWALRQETMGTVLDYFKEFGSGGMTVCEYDESNPEAKTVVKKQFEDSTSGVGVLYVPVPKGLNQKGTASVYRVSAPGEGNSIFLDWCDGYFDKWLVQLFVGQELSGTAKQGGGWGGGEAKLQGHTLQQLNLFDARNWDATATRDWLMMLKRLNDPGAKWGLRWVTMLDRQAPAEIMEALGKAYEMDATIPESHIHSVAGIPNGKPGERLLRKSQIEKESLALQSQVAAAGGAGGTDADGKPRPAPKPVEVQPLEAEAKPATKGPAKVADLKTDPERFQYKQSADSDEDDDQPYDPDQAGLLLTWIDPADGQEYVVDGHGRIAKARKAGVDTIDRLVVAAQSAADAMAIGAIANIAAGRGTATDAAMFFRDTGLTMDDVLAQGPIPSETLARSADVLTRLSDALFQKLVAGTLPESRALAIAGRKPEAQEQAVAMADESEAAGKTVTVAQMGELAEMIHVGVIPSLEKAVLRSYVRGRLSRDNTAPGLLVEKFTARVNGDLDKLFTTRAGEMKDGKDNRNETEAAVRSILESDTGARTDPDKQIGSPGGVSGGAADAPGGSVLPETALASAGGESGTLASSSGSAGPGTGETTGGPGSFEVVADGVAASADAWGALTVARAGAIVQFISPLGRPLFETNDPAVDPALDALEAAANDRFRKLIQTTRAIFRRKG